jgi:hypothetical protein
MFFLIITQKKTVDITYMQKKCYLCKLEELYNQ